MNNYNTNTSGLKFPNKKYGKKSTFNYNDGYGGKDLNQSYDYYYQQNSDRTSEMDFQKKMYKNKKNTDLNYWHTPNKNNYNY